jgi:ABC-type methionine transport system permease subunit
LLSFITDIDPNEIFASFFGGGGMGGNPFNMGFSRFSSNPTGFTFTF